MSHDSRRMGLGVVFGVLSLMLAGAGRAGRASLDDETAKLHGSSIKSGSGRSRSFRSLQPLSAIPGTTTS